MNTKHGGFGLLVVISVLIVGGLAHADSVPGGLEELPPLVELGINGGATVDVEATRGTAVQVDETLAPPEEQAPPTQAGPPGGDGSYSNGRCVGWEAKLAYYSPGWSVERMSRIMYRESRCQPGAHNSAGANGLLQVMRSNCPFISRELGESCSADKLRQPDFNIRAARELFQYDGYGPWAATR